MLAVNILGRAPCTAARLVSPEATSTPRWGRYHPKTTKIEHSFTNKQDGNDENLYWEEILPPNIKGTTRVEQVNRPNELKMNVRLVCA